MSTARPLRSRRFPRLFALAIASAGVLAACNSLTGVNDLNIVPGGVGTAGTGGDATGTGGAAVGGAALGQACGTCVTGLDCVFGKCRKPCQDDSEAACAGTSCLTEQAAQKSGCRLDGETCENGTGTGVLACGPDKILRAACDAAKTCRNDQECINGTCIGKDEKSTPWGKCGKQGKTCVGDVLTVCDIKAPGVTSPKCGSADLCKASLPGEGNACVLCGAGENLCTIDVNMGKLVSGASCTADGSGFTFSPCQDTQCNPLTGLCQAIVVDTNEVTRKEYQAFLAEVMKGGTDKLRDGDPAVPNACFGNPLTPDVQCVAQATTAGVYCVEGGTPGSCDQHPVVCVDWCDAFAYCQAQGKRLCGKIGGSLNDNLPLADFDKPGVSEWMNACTVGGRWPFATDTDTYTSAGAGTIGQDCNAKDTGMNKPRPVGAQPNCRHQSPGYGSRDLLGNVREWESSCAMPATTSGAGLTDKCHARGASYRSEDDEEPKLLSAKQMRCEADETELRQAHKPDLGFRCCGKKL